MATKKVKNTKVKVKSNVEASPDSLASVPVTQSIIEKQLAANRATQYRKSIKQLIGESQSPYSQNTIEEYQRYIETLNTADLEIHASSLGIPYTYDREMMEKHLLREFNIRSSEYFANVVIQPMQKKKISAEMLKILSEGRA
jgi:hypothetical protein